MNEELSPVAPRSGDLQTRTVVEWQQKWHDLKYIKMKKLEKYCSHKRNCNSRHPVYPEQGQEGDMSCDCGLDEALE